MCTGENEASVCAGVCVCFPLHYSPSPRLHCEGSMRGSFTVSLNDCGVHAHVHIRL